MAKLPERELAKRAEEVLRNHRMWQIPVDPFAIVNEEEIELAPGEYKSRFDGRIKYLEEIDAYSLAYRVRGQGRSEGRVRFTIAHELGHYYLHRDYLRSGHSHSSQVDFRSGDEMEQEADEFAASLLMPMELFRKKVRDYRQQVCDLKDLCSLSESLGTSITSTVRRYCQADIEPVAAIFSTSGSVRWACFSEDMTRLGMGFVPFGEALPGGSLTLAANGQRRVSGELHTDVWFDRAKYEGNLWEEAMPLGETGVTLTYLSLADNPWHDSSD